MDTIKGNFFGSRIGNGAMDTKFNIYGKSNYLIES